MTKELLFTITRNDFEWQYFRSGGAGGQNQNKVSSGCRCIHKESGARGESREERDQWQNRKNAFERCTKTKTFQVWLKTEIARRTGEEARIKERVERMMMNLKDFKVEYLEDGKVVKVE
jgi:protein subunit release factor B